MPVKYEVEPIIEEAINKIAKTLRDMNAEFPIDSSVEIRGKLISCLSDINKVLLDQDICITLLTLKLNEKIKKELHGDWSNRKDLDKIEELESKIEEYERQRSKFS